MQTGHHQPSFKVGGSSPQLGKHALGVQEDDKAEAVGRSALRPAFPEARRPLLPWLGADAAGGRNDGPEPPECHLRP